MALDGSPTLVVEVDTDAGSLEGFLEAAARAMPEGTETIFICGRDRIDAARPFLEPLGSVLVPPKGADRIDALCRAMDLSKGDPIVFVRTSDDLPRGLFDGIVTAFRGRAVGAAFAPRDDAVRAGLAGEPFGCFAVCRRAFDTLGHLRDAESIEMSLLDYRARLEVAGFACVAAEGTTVPTSATADLPSSGTAELPSPEAVESLGADLSAAYAGGDAPLHYRRQRHRDHLRKGPVELASFAFVTRDRFDYLTQTWERLFEITPALQDLRAEYLFVDNASAPEVREWLLARDAWVLLNSVNTGIASARNQVLAMTQGDPIIMIDPDILLPEGWWERALEVLSAPAIGFSAVSEEPGEYEIMKIEGVEVELKHGNIAGVWIIPRRTLDVLGWFNEEYQFYGGEDSDYGTRIMLSGMVNTYLPHMKGEHIGAGDGVYSGTDSDYVRMKAKWWDINMALHSRRAGEYQRGERPLRVERAKYLL